MKNKTYSLKLKSHSNKKRLLEALEELKNIYPFKLKAEDIYIEKTKEKGSYLVYIGKVEKQKKRKLIKTLFISLMLIFVIILTLIIANRIVENQNKEKLAEQEIENQNIKKIEAERALKEELKIKKEQYKEILNAEYYPVYPILEELYKCLIGKTTIENISISNDTFFVEVRTEDCVKVLRKFEESNNFTLVKMNKTTIVDNNEIVTFSGKYQNSKEYPLDTLSIEEKIRFYDEKIKEAQTNNENEKDISISTYIEKIKYVLKTNLCKEEYIQTKGNLKDIEVECFFTASSTNLLNFIKQIQEIDNPRFWIKEIRINNKAKSIQVIVSFASGIEVKADELELLEGSKISIEPNDLSKLFNKSSAIAKTNTEIEKKQDLNISKKIEQIKLLYVGKATINNEIKVVVKDEQMNSLYKLIQVTDEIEENCFFIENEKMIAKINNKYYEVIK